MQMTKKVLSIVLAVMMVVSMMSVMAVTANAASGVAKIGDTYYDTLEEAFAAATDGAYIQVLANCNGNGIKVPQGKFSATGGLTVDFGGHTYTMDGTLVGSTGTETQAFQLLKDNTITFTNGAITSTKAKMLIQNYSNLTLDKMTLTLNNPDYTSAYTLSNNNGEVYINDTTINANPAGGFAFDACRYSSYPSVSVNVTGNSVINGDVEVSASNNNAMDGLNLNLVSGEIRGTVVVDPSAETAIANSPQNSEITTAPTFEIYVATIGNNKYATLEAAFAAAQDGNTITLVADCAGNGIIAPQGKFATGLTVDFDGHTYVQDGTLVGSTGTETQAFQLLKDNTITFKNGTITSTKAKMLIQNYSNLTLDNMTLTLNNPNYAYAYTLSNNNGNVVIDDTTINANPAGGFAFDVCRFSSYPSVNVTVTGASVINGDVEVSASNGQAKDGFSLTLESGTMTGDIVVDASAENLIGDDNKVTKADSFTKTAPDGFKWVDNGNGTSSLAEVNYVAQINSTKYETIGKAIEAAQDGDTIELLDDVNIGTSWYRVNKDVTFDLGGKTITGNDSFIVVGSGADVTIKNGTVTSDVTGDYVLYADGNLTIEDDATIIASAARGNGIIVRNGGQADVYGTIESGYYSIAGFGTAVVNVYDGAFITSTDASCISGNGSGGNEGYTFNVMGGTLTSTNDVAIYHPNQGTLNITGGTITGKTAIYIKSGTTDVSSSGTSITGATIRGTGAQSAMVHSGNGCNATGDAIVIENCGYPGGTPSIGISGGTIVSDNAQDVGSYAYNADSSTNYEPITGFVSGGAFGHVVPEEQCADGFKPVTTANAQGKYEVTTKTLQEYADTATSGITGLQFVDNTSTDNFTNAFEASLLGVQLRKNNVEYEDTYGSNDLRYIAAVKKTFLATLDNYGFAFSNDGTHYTEVSCKGTKNTVITAGQDDKYEYFTAALKNIPDSAKGQKLYVKFYVKDGNDTAYAKYTKVNPQDTHQIIASYNDVVAAANGN